MKSLSQKYDIHAPIEMVWQALVDPKIISQWGGGPVKMDSKNGSKFSLWGGDIHGTNTEVLDQKKLSQDWYGGDWEKPSKVIFILTKMVGGTRVALKQSDIPDKELKDIEDGWKQYYLGSLKELLEK